MEMIHKESLRSANSPAHGTMFHSLVDHMHLFPELCLQVPALFFYEKTGTVIQGFDRGIFTHKSFGKQTGDFQDILFVVNNQDRIHEVL